MGLPKGRLLKGYGEVRCDLAVGNASRPVKIGAPADLSGETVSTASGSGAGTTLPSFKAASPIGRLRDTRGGA